tara:strand:- start:992 stop:2848 length:1857 start_codon:yes stop_codon:yes gene_type:complete
MAGRIPQHFIDDILDRVDIVEVIDRRVSLKKTGRNYSACCPFHNEKTPSFSVNPDKQFFYCFGCGAGGNSIGFIMDYENLDFPAAVESLASVAGLEVPREASNSVEQRQRKSESQGLYDTLAWAAKHFQLQLRQHSNKAQAIDYLKNRGLSGEVARDFGIGYAPPGWDHLLNALALGEQRPRQIKQLETCGMLVKKDNGDFYDRFRERIIFPIRDNRGRVIAFGGRVLNDDKPKYLNSPETPVFSKQRELYGLFEARKANRQLDYILMVEGYMDVVSLVQFGITNAVATLGTASSIVHLEKIFRHSSKLVVCFDGDAAGKKAATRLLETALPAMTDGREICFLFLPDGEDPDTYVRQHGKIAFGAQVDNATPLEVLLIETASEGIKLNSDAGKAKLSQRALPLIQQLPHGVFKQLMLRKLASITGADIHLLASQEATISAKKSQSAAEAISSSPRPAAKATDKDARPADTQVTIGLEKTPMVWAIALLLHYPQLADQHSLPSCIDQFNSEEAKLLRLLMSHIQTQRQTVTTSQLLGYWHGTAESGALNHCASRHKTPENIAVAEQEFVDILSSIERQFARHQRSQLVAALMKKPLSALSDDEKNTLKSVNSSRAKKID